MKGIDYREDPDGFIYHDIQALFVISHVQFCLVLATLELDSDINYLFGGNVDLGDSSWADVEDEEYQQNQQLSEDLRQRFRVAHDHHTRSKLCSVRGCDLPESQLIGGRQLS